MSVGVCRLLIDPPQSGAWNMSVDEALLEEAAAASSDGTDSAPTTLRLYAWSEPTLSLGYFQASASRAEHPESVHCPLVRRQTGGGAIVHDDEWTYSLVVPEGHPLARDAPTLYRVVHQGIVQWLARQGVAATLCERGASDAPAERFLCFQRRAPGDVLIGLHKVCGSAQRRVRQAVMQHGSLLLGRSPAAPQLPGLREITGLSRDRLRLAGELADEIVRSLSMQPERYQLDASLGQRASQLQRQKYLLEAWTFRR